MQQLIYAWRTSTAWRRERVGRASMAVEAGVEKEQVRDMDMAAVGNAVDEVPTWT
jgi:hypothetical protein